MSLSAGTREENNTHIIHYVIRLLVIDGIDNFIPPVFLITVQILRQATMPGIYGRSLANWAYAIVKLLTMEEK